MELSTVLQEAAAQIEAMERKLEEQAEQLAMQEEIVNLAEQLTVAVACYRAKYDADIRAFCDKPAPQSVEEDSKPARKSGRRRYTEEDAAEWYRLRTEENLSDYQISQRVGACFETVQRWLADYQPPKPDPAAIAAEALGQIGQVAQRVIEQPAPSPQVAATVAALAELEQGSEALRDRGLICRYCGKPVGEEGRGGVCARCIQERTHQTSDGGWACAVA